MSTSVELGKAVSLPPCIYPSTAIIWRLPIHPSTMADLSPLHAFLAAHPTVRHATPKDNTYSALRACFVVDEALEPPLIVQPSCADHVASLVSVCADHRIPFTVRARP